MSTYDQWANAKTAPAERVVAFEAWVYAELAKRLRWPEGKAERERQIGQARGWVLQVVDDLNRHGFLFRPRDLRDLIVDKLDQVGRLQAEGKVRELWPYLRSAWDGYVRKEADRLRDTAMTTGAHVSQVLGRAIAAGTRGGQERSMVELLAEVRAARRSERAGGKDRTDRTDTTDQTELLKL